MSTFCNVHFIEMHYQSANQCFHIILWSFSYFGGLFGNLSLSSKSRYRLWTPFQSILMDAIVGISLPPFIWMAVVSSTVNTDLNFWFSMFILLCMNLSMFLRGATPVASWTLLLTYVQNFLEFSL